MSSNDEESQVSRYHIDSSFTNLWPNWLARLVWSDNSTRLGLVGSSGFLTHIPRPLRVLVPWLVSVYKTPLPSPSQGTHLRSSFMQTVRKAPDVWLWLWLLRSSSYVVRKWHMCASVLEDLIHVSDSILVSHLSSTVRTNLRRLYPRYQSSFYHFICLSWRFILILNKLRFWHLGHEYMNRCSHAPRFRRCRMSRGRLLGVLRLDALDAVFISCLILHSLMENFSRAGLTQLILIINFINFDNIIVIKCKKWNYRCIKRAVKLCGKKKVKKLAMRGGNRSSWPEFHQEL